MERGAKPAKAKVEARPSVTRRSRTVDGSTGRQLEQRLAEALEQQAATSEILRVISASPTDVRPVLHAVAERAALLCKAPFARVLLAYGDRLRVAAEHSVDGTMQARTTGVRLSRSSITGRAMLDRTIIHHADILPLLDTEFPDARENARRIGFRAVLAVPLMHEGGALGAIFLWRRELGLFAPQHVALVETFARQAAIAIDNVRLFNETKEALERQTATSEILRVISQSQTDVQPVFDTIASAALNLCGASTANVVTFDGELIHLVAFANLNPEVADALRQLYPRPPGRDRATPRAILTRSVVAIPDVEKDPEYVIPSHEYAITARGVGFRSILSVPLMREARPIGAITVGRPQPGTFSEKQIALLQTFADQAVIAIENVRLFNETKEALDQQRASGEVLAAISSSIADTAPVFERILASCERLFAGKLVQINLVGEDGLVHLGAYHGRARENIEHIFPFPVDETSATGVAILSRAVVHFADVDGAEDVPERARKGWEAMGIKAAIGAPMLWEGRGIGSILVGRDYAGPFSEKEISLLKTFADQAVIAIQNARLFNETKEALERQTATSQILRAISGSLTDIAPVFDAILENAIGLCGGDVAGLWQYDGHALRFAAGKNTSQEGEAYLRGHSFELGTYNPTPRAGLERHTMHVLDVFAEPGYRPLVPPGIATYRPKAPTVLAVPLLRENDLLGVITIWRFEKRLFTEKQVEMVNTFADQAVIAIENARLFKELQARTEALSRSVHQLTALGEVGQAISSTLELETVLKTIVSRAVQLTGLDGGSIYEYDERAEEFRLQAAENMPQNVAEDIRKAPTRKGDGALGRTAVTLEPTQVPDTLDGSYHSARKELLIRAGYRALLAVPLLREDHLLGGLLVNRKTPGAFAPEIVELLKTFATQSALAIQNARLFREIAEKGRQLEAASRHKSDFLASMSHELRTPLNAILGFNEMILGQVYGEVPADMQVPLADIQTSGKHLLRLINNVLDLAKIEAGRMELTLADYSVHDTVESVRATLRPLAADKGLELVATVPADIPLAYGDSGRITQCLMNLAGNSLKFTKAGKVEISVEHKDGLLRYRVADTGIGIAPDKLESVFLEFKQSDSTIASEYGGTGLGLSISKKFVEMQGGRIWVESELGKGSTFVFEIPLRVRAREAA